MCQNRTANPEGMSPARTLLDIVTSSWMSQAAYVAAELRIADFLADGPRTSDDLAAATGTHGPSLHRLLRALTTLDICRERDDGSFEITPMGRLLGTDAPGSLRSWTIWWGSHLWPIWGNLLYSIKTGESARKLFMETNAFEQLERNRGMAATFNQALVECTRLICKDVVRVYDFSGLRRIMDVGGGYGELLACILKANPDASGVLFDLPHAVEGGRRHIEAAGLTSRCEFVEGSFFDSVPSGADVYLLKNVIHDWNDDRSRLILENCRSAMGEGGLLLLVEAVLPDRLTVAAAHQAVAQSDLNMLVTLAGRERTEAEFRDLLASTGFRVTRILPAGATFSVIEALPSEAGPGS
jgi:SAM-dependent methyltransferase